MNFSQKQINYVILGVTSITLSRVLLGSFKDPEGPNLLIVGVFALCIFGLSLGVLALTPFKIGGKKRVPLVVLFQILLVILLHFILS